MLYSKADVSPSAAISHGETKKFSADQITAGQAPSTILQRIAAADEAAPDECLNKHGRLVWALAKQFTSSTEEAEAATQEIFLDIWKYADRFDAAKCGETDFVVLIARRWLIKRKIESTLASRGTTSSG